MATTPTLESYQVGSVLNAISARVSADKTKPPPYYTQTSLVDDMINAHRFATNEKDREILKETEGLGTSRTRGAAVTDTITKGLLTEVKKGRKSYLHVTNLGVNVVLAVPAQLTDIATTAKWELLLKNVSLGKVDPALVRKALRANVASMVSTLKLAHENKNKR